MSALISPTSMDNDERVEFFHEVPPLTHSEYERRRKRLKRFLKYENEARKSQVYALKRLIRVQREMNAYSAYLESITGTQEPINIKYEFLDILEHVDSSNKGSENLAWQILVCRRDLPKSYV